MESYDPAKVGTRIAWGRTHSVYRYGENEAIKLPRLERYLGPLLEDRLHRDISVCREYFRDFYVDTRIVQNPKTGQLASIQPYIQGRYLSKKELEDPAVLSQFQDLLRCYESLIDAGYAPVDLVGEGGIFSRRLSNVFVTQDKQLKLFDATLLDARDVPYIPWLVTAFFKRVIKRQNRTLAYLRS
jgi:hypothetical protein